MALFYTGKGDGGTSKIKDKKLDKDSTEIEALGNLDELNSLLGLIGVQSIPAVIKPILKEVQENLFIIQANISSFNNEGQAAPLSEEKVLQMEAYIDKIEEQIKPKRGFIIPGETVASAWLDVGRTVARRAERSVVSLSKEKTIDPAILAYLNRLSGLLFALGRFSVKAAAKEEKNPSYQ